MRQSAVVQQLNDAVMHHCIYSLHYKNTKKSVLQHNRKHWESGSFFHIAHNNTDFRNLYNLTKAATLNFCRTCLQNSLVHVILFISEKVSFFALAGHSKQWLSTNETLTDMVSLHVEVIQNVKTFFSPTKRPIFSFSRLRYAV